MAHFNFVISQNAKWGHAGFYIDCHRMTVPENILLQKKHWLQLCVCMLVGSVCTMFRPTERVSAYTDVVLYNSVKNVELRLTIT